MDIFEKILSDYRLSPFVVPACEDEGMLVEIDPTIASLVIKVDNFYNSLHLGDTLASPDCLILQKCIGGGYAVTHVELKNINSSQSFEIPNLIQKFQTCLGDFMSFRFREYFSQDYNRILLYFVSKIRKTYRKDKGLRLESLIDKRFAFRNRKNLMIRLEMPVPALKPCYNKNKKIPSGSIEASASTP